MVGLKIQPHLGGPAEVAFEAQGGIDSDSPLAFDDFIDAPGRHADVFGNAVFRKAKWGEEVFLEDLAGMNGSVCFHGNGFSGNRRFLPHAARPFSR